MKKLLILMLSIVVSNTFASNIPKEDSSVGYYCMCNDDPYNPGKFLISKNDKYLQEKLSKDIPAARDYNVMLYVGEKAKKECFNKCKEENEKWNLKVLEGRYSDGQWVPYRVFPVFRKP